MEKNELKNISKKGFRPPITFSEKELPQILDWKPGQKYHLILEVEMTGIEKVRDWSVPTPIAQPSEKIPSPPKIFRGSFEVSAVGVDEDYHTEYARRMANRK